jgi:Zn-dependent protease with chaperone function
VRVVLFVIPVELAFKLDHHDPYGTASNLILAVLAFGSLGWSVTALVHPLASGRFWQAQTGGRAPSQREREIVEDAFSEIHAADPAVRVPRAWFVLDEWAFNAAIFGDTMMVTTALLDDPALTAVIAHELGHLNSPDGYVVAALTRLGTPARLLIPVCDHLGERGGCLLVPLAGVMGLASGNWGLRLASPLWDVWWRAREFKADAYAAPARVRRRARRRPGPRSPRR